MVKRAIGWVDVTAELALHFLGPAQAPREDGKIVGYQPANDAIPADVTIEYVSPMPDRTVRIGFSGDGVEQRQYRPTMQRVYLELKDT